MLCVANYPLVLPQSDWLRKMRVSWPTLRIMTLAAVAVWGFFAFFDPQAAARIMYRLDGAAAVPYELEHVAIVVGLICALSGSLLLMLCYIIHSLNRRY
jgi:hypothetical protein